MIKPAGIRTFWQEESSTGKASSTWWIQRQNTLLDLIYNLSLKQVSKVYLNKIVVIYTVRINSSTFPGVIIESPLTFSGQGFVTFNEIGQFISGDRFAYGNPGDLTLDLYKKELSEEVWTGFTDNFIRNLRHIGLQPNTYNTLLNRVDQIFPRVLVLFNTLLEENRSLYLSIDRIIPEYRRGVIPTDLLD